MQGRGPTRLSTRDPDKGPVDVTKHGGGSELGEKDFCGVWWEEKPDLLCVEKSVGDEEVEKASGDSVLKKCGCWGGERPGSRWSVTRG